MTAPGTQPPSDSSGPAPRPPGSSGGDLGPPAIESRATRFVALVVAALLAALIAAPVQGAYYAQRLQWSSSGLGTWDRVVLHWAIASASLSLVAPILAAAALLLWRGRPRAAVFLAEAGVAIVFILLAIDQRVASVSGNHLVQYASFVGGGNFWELARGGFQDAVRPAVEIIVVASLVVFLISEASLRAFRRVARSCPVRRGKRGACAAALFLVALLGPSVAIFTMGRPLALYILADSLPLPIALCEVAHLQGDDLVEKLNVELRRFPPARLLAASALRPIDEALRIPRGPNVIVLTIESLRLDALDPRFMPRVWAWSRRGLRLGRHSSPANTSHLALFALLYGRSPLAFNATLDAKEPSQLARTLQLSGYRRLMFSSTTLTDNRLGDFLGPLNFDDTVSDQGDDWPERDARTLTEIRGALARASQPTYVQAHLMSTHAEYRYPSRYDDRFPNAFKNGVDWTKVAALPRPQFAARLLDRYHNSLAFMDDLLGDFLEPIDPRGTIVAICGDHGEAFLEDDYFFHSSRLSDAQTRAAFAMVGPGVPPLTLDTPTTHMDLVPTLLHAIAGQPVAVAHSQGRDLLAPLPPAEPFLLVDPALAELLLVTERGRLQLRLSPDRARLTTQGFYDERAHFVAGTQGGERDVAWWTNEVARELDRLAR